MTHSALKPFPTTAQGSAMAARRPVSSRGMRATILLVLVALLISLLLLSIATGSVNIPLSDIVSVVTGGEASTAARASIILKFRVPKALTAALAGAALAVGGLQMQTFFRNPLAGPFVLGISSGASLGVALVVLSAGGVGATLLTGNSLPGDIGLAIAASIGSGIVMALVLLVARHIQSSMTLLILGVLFGYLVNALVSLLLFFSIAERIQAYINWTYGSFNGVTWSQLKVMGPAIIVGLMIALLLSKPLNALLLGENYARSMGLNIHRARLWIVASTAILAGTVTAFAGPITFIGVAVPHLCRSLFGTSDHRILIPSTIIVGAIVALLAALIAELPGNRIVLPLNAITAFIGAPIVIWVILRRRNLRNTFAG